MCWRRRRRCLRVRGRWRPCVVVFLYYLLAVILVENILISIVHHRQSPITPADYYDVAVVRDNLSSSNVVETTAPRTTTTPTTTVSTLRATASQNRSTHRTVAAPPTSPSTKELEELFYRRRPHPVNPYGHRVLLEPTRLCRPDTRMVILVHSHHPHQDRRDAIRSTWGEAVRTGSWPRENRTRSCAGLRLAFVFGLHRDPGLNDLVAEEHARHDDVVQGDFADSYQNMTLKSLLDLKVVDEHCPRVRYLLKTDDDMVVNLPYLLDILTRTSPTRSFMGPYNPRSRVNRNGVWKLTLDEFPFQFYPPYESGSAYVITGDLIHELFVTAEYVPHIFVDDVYVTGILGRVLGVKHIRQAGFAYWGTKAPTACDLVKRRIITGTKMHPQRLCALWNDLQLNPKC